MGLVEDFSINAVAQCRPKVGLWGDPRLLEGFPWVLAVNVTTERRGRRRRLHHHWHLSAVFSEGHQRGLYVRHNSYCCFKEIGRRKLTVCSAASLIACRTNSALERGHMRPSCIGNTAETP